MKAFKPCSFHAFVVSLVIASVLWLAQAIAAHAQRRTIAVPQSPDDLCRCSGDDSASRGGVRTFEEFTAQYGAKFATRQELELAWRVYRAVNRCNSVVVLGRLADTDQFERRAGYCVLRNLVGWTMRVNEIFVRAATDRGARIQLVSDMPPEIMGGNVDVNKIGPDDREADWIVIYNNEIQWVLRTGHYRLAYDKSRKITPAEPAFLQPSLSATPAPNPSTGKLQLVGITPDPKCETWNFYPTCNPNAGQIVARAPWGTATYQWTAPPQQIGPEGVTITMSVSEQTPPQGRVATGLNLVAGGFDLNPPSASIPIGAPNQPLSGTLAVTVKPPKNPTGDLFLKIGVYWGPGFTYRYRVAQ